MPLAPLDLVSAHAWERATFTTYALSLSFFEAIILDALIRGRARHALILADVRGIRASLSEQGAQRERGRCEGNAVHPRSTGLLIRQDTAITILDTLTPLGVHSAPTST